MRNSDILRRVRYAFNFSDSLMIEIFRRGGIALNEEKLKNHLKKEEEEGYVPLDPKSLLAFLDGLILKKRGPRKTPAPQPPTSERFSNNLILRKLRIALEFKEEDILAVLKRSEVEISRGELSALFRTRGHKHFKDCGDQILRNFLAGLAGYKRPAPDDSQKK
jgi:uncharacterized protein YehS (DUF1456 family)